MMRGLLTVAALFALNLAPSYRALCLPGSSGPTAQGYLFRQRRLRHCDISTPDLGSAVFISDGSPSGPQFRLVYEMKDAVMSDKFQMRMPGQAESKAYLEWSGAKK
jgi:hypothetical protein